MSFQDVLDAIDELCWSWGMCPECDGELEVIDEKKGMKWCPKCQRTYKRLK